MRVFLLSIEKKLVPKERKETMDEEDIRYRVNIRQSFDHDNHAYTFVISGYDQQSEKTASLRGE